MRIEGGQIKVTVDAGGWSWWFTCEINPKPTFYSPCRGLNNSGNEGGRYNLFFSYGMQCWVWNDSRLRDSNLRKFRYISLSYAESDRNKSTDLAGLQR